MKVFDDARDLLEKLSKILPELDHLIQEKEKKCLDKIKEKEFHEQDIRRAISKEIELSDILENCSNDVCKYKLAAQEIRDEFSKEIPDRINQKRFHFFMCFRGNYYANPSAPYSDRISVIDAHQEVIDKFGSVWWAKFFRRRVETGGYEDLEPFGESIKVDDYSSVASKIKRNVTERLNNGELIYLFNYSPNPPKIELYMCNLIDFCYGKDIMPYEEETDRVPPECHLFPRYYFLKRDGNCISCRKRDPARCILQFTSNFWFKINRIERMEEPQAEFAKFKNCFTNDSINLAIPILYPLLVFQEVERPSPAELLKQKGFNSMHIITDKQSSVQRIIEWLETEELTVTSDIVNYTEVIRFAQGLSKRKYIADILVYEWGKLRHFQDFSDSLSGKYKKKCVARTITNIIDKLKKWITDADS